MAKGLLGFIEGFFGKQKKDVAKLRPTVDDVISVRSQYESISDEELRAKRQEFSDRYNGGETLGRLAERQPLGRTSREAHSPDFNLPCRPLDE